MNLEMMDSILLFCKYQIYFLVKNMYVLNMFQDMLVAGHMIHMDQPLTMCVLRTRQF